MHRFLHTLWDTGFRLRCPVCEQGKLFRGWFDMHALCPHCHVRFERYQGEMVGGMTISIVVTSIVFLCGLYITEFILHWSLWLQLVIWVSYAIFFPVLFYRYSRALWVVILHLGGDVFWDREPYIESDRSIVDAFLHRPGRSARSDSGADTPPPEDDDDLATHQTQGVE